MRDELVFFLAGLARLLSRLLRYVLVALAMPFLFAAFLVWSIVLSMLPTLVSLLAVIAVGFLIIAGVFAWHHEWNSVARGAVFAVGASLVCVGLSSVMEANADEYWRSYWWDRVLGRRQPLHDDRPVVGPQVCDDDQMDSAMRYQRLDQQLHERSPAGRYSEHEF